MQNMTAGSQARLARVALVLLLANGAQAATVGSLIRAKGGGKAGLRAVMHEGHQARRRQDNAKVLGESAAGVDGTFKSFDADGDGRLELSEAFAADQPKKEHELDDPFVKWQGRWMTPRQKLLWQHADADGDGKLDAAEFRVFHHPEFHTDTPELERAYYTFLAKVMVASADADGDRQVTRDEYAAHRKRHREMYNWHKDGAKHAPPELRDAHAEQIMAEELKRFDLWADPDKDGKAGVEALAEMMHRAQNNDFELDFNQALKHVDKDADGEVAKPDYREPELRDLAATAPRPLPDGAGRDDGDVEDGMTYAPPSSAAAEAALAAATAAAAADAPPNSIKRLDVNLKRLDDDYLGRHVPAYNHTQIKAGVMRLAAEPKVPRFSRMSGIQAWRNAVMLFVNVDRSTYNNVFLEGGACMVWFAQNTQHADTPVIQRLLRAPAAASAPAVAVKREGGSGGGKTEGARPKDAGTAVLLFCRLPGEEYIYCGRLGYCRHNPSSRPMRFVWRLLDFAALRAAPAYKDMFDDPAFSVVDVTQEEE